MAINGSWKLTLETPFGTQTPTLVIDGDKGHLTSPEGEVALQDLKVSGDTAEFTATIPTPMGTFPIGFTASASGDELSGNFKSPLGLTPYSGTRA